MWHKTRAISWVVLFVLFGGAACGAPTTMPPPTPTATTIPSLTIETGVLSVGLDQAWPPFQFVDDAGQATGFDMDITRAIAEKMGLTPKFVPGDWDAVQVMLRTSKVDIIMALTPTEERAMIFDFSDIYITLGIAVFVKSDSTAQRIENLYGKPVSIEAGDKSAAQAMSDHLSQIRATEVSNIEEAMSALKDGTVEGAIVTKEVGSYLAHQMGLQYRQVFEVEAGSPSTVGVKKGNTTLLAEINRTLAEIKADGTYDRIYNKWFGQ